MPLSAPFLERMDDAARAQFLRQLEEKPTSTRPAFLAYAQSLFTALPEIKWGEAGEECGKELPSARRWKVVLDGYAYFTCAHKDPHVELATA